MIFNSNTTALGASTIPMAEGYDCSYGAPLALVESARNDYAMFKAMVNADYKEIAICKESTGVVQEGEISSLHEAVGGGIFKKIAELFSKLIAKVKAIFHTFMSKINSLCMDDVKLVNKYWKELQGKSNIGNLEVKWRKKGPKYETLSTFTLGTKFAEEAGWSEDAWECEDYYLKDTIEKSTESMSEYRKEAMKNALEEEKATKISEIGGIGVVCDFIKKYKDKMNKMKSDVDAMEKSLKPFIDKYKKAADNAGEATSKDTTDDTKAKDYQKANRIYEMAQAYQKAQMLMTDVAKNILTIEYKQNKAAFMKAIAANNNKLKAKGESAILLDAIAEATENEVEDVINGALSKEELSDFCAASKNVKDGDVSDDPDKLTYGPDCYTDHPEVWDGTNGNIDSCIGGGKVEVKESAYFGKLLY